MKSQYDNPKVDRVIYGTESQHLGIFSRADWVDLAIACLDQAGLSSAEQRMLRELANAYLQADSGYLLCLSG